MKKKTIANLVMAAIILVIAAAGLLAVGHIRGWFDKPTEDTALLTAFRGIITLEREGVAYRAAEDTVLRAGDRITCESGATVKILVGEGYLTLGQQAQAEISVPAAAGFAMELTGGEAFINTVSPVTVFFDGKQVEFADTAAWLSVRSGAQSVSVFDGAVEDAQAGQKLEWIGQERTVSALSLTGLNEFQIGQLRLAGESRTLCFTMAELDALEESRLAQLQAQLTTPTAPAQTEPAQTEPPETAAPTEAAQTAKPSDTAPNPPATEPARTEPPAETVPPETETPPETTPPTQPNPSCTITIRCDTILNNMDSLDPAKAGYVPANGYILSGVRVEFTEGETVFDVLKRACAAYGIQLEYSWTPMYNSYYVEGIHNLYEFDCGSQSGWMYQVNGWFPNYGCSAYSVSDGDSIVWCYTCNGLGADVGG